MLARVQAPDLADQQVSRIRRTVLSCASTAAGVVTHGPQGDPVVPNVPRPAHTQAERRARDLRTETLHGERSPSRAPSTTRRFLSSGDVAEIEAWRPESPPRPRGSASKPPTPEPRSAKRAEAKAQKEAKRHEPSRSARERAARQKQKQAKTERQRSGVIGFLVFVGRMS